MDYLVVFFFSAGLSYLFTIPTITFAKKFHLTTDATLSSHPAHTHTGILPRAGGAPMLLALLIASIWFLAPSKIMTGILLGAALTVIMGLIDDYYDVSPYIRFMGNIVIASIAIGFGLGIPYISNPFGGTIPLYTIVIPLWGGHTIWLLADLFALFWLTWTTNSINWSKGVDGQMPGLVAISALFIALFADKTLGHGLSYANVVILGLIVSGAFAGFLPHNIYPQKILPGYGGGSLAGFMLGVLSIISFAKVGALLFILAIPTIDAMYTILRRIAQKKNPFKGDRKHFHHRLLDIGWGRRRIAVFYWLMAFVMGFAGLFLDGIQKVYAFVGVMVFMLIIMLFLEKIKRLQTTSV